jgi:hypothetical protein
LLQVVQICCSFYFSQLFKYHVDNRDLTADRMKPTSSAGAQGAFRVKVARKFAPPANLPGKGPAEEVGMKWQTSNRIYTFSTAN